MDALMASILSYKDAVIDLGKECNSASFHPDHVDFYCSALENFICQHELLVSEFGKLTCSVDAMTEDVRKLTEDVRELTVAIRAHAVVPDAVQTEKHNVAASLTSPLPEVAVEHNMDAPEETVDPSSTSPVDPKKIA